VQIAYALICPLTCSGSHDSVPCIPPPSTSAYSTAHKTEPFECSYPTNLNSHMHIRRHSPCKFISQRCSPHALPCHTRTWHWRPASRSFSRPSGKTLGARPATSCSTEPSTTNMPSGLLAASALFPPGSITATSSSARHSSGLKLCHVKSVRPCTIYAASAHGSRPSSAPSLITAADTAAPVSSLPRFRWIWFSGLSLASGPTCDKPQALRQLRLAGCWRRPAILLGKMRGCAADALQILGPGLGTCTTLRHSRRLGPYPASPSLSVANLYRWSVFARASPPAIHFCSGASQPRPSPADGCFQSFPQIKRSCFNRVPVRVSAHCVVAMRLVTVATVRQLRFATLRIRIRSPVNSQRVEKQLLGLECES
jgi:hypothetical protein